MKMKKWQKICMVVIVFAFLDGISVSIGTIEAVAEPQLVDSRSATGEAYRIKGQLATKVMPKSHQQTGTAMKQTNVAFENEEVRNNHVGNSERNHGSNWGNEQESTPESYQGNSHENNHEHNSQVGGTHNQADSQQHMRVKADTENGSASRHHK